MVVGRALGIDESQKHKAELDLIAAMLADSVFEAPVLNRIPYDMDSIPIAISIPISTRAKADHQMLAGSGQIRALLLRRLPLSWRISIRGLFFALGCLCESFLAARGSIP